MKVVLVTGGRAYPEQVKVNEVLFDEQPDLVMHGGAKRWDRERRTNVGADYFAEQWAESYIKAQLKYPANFDAFGPRGGPMRNSWMVLLLDGFRQLGHDCKVVAFPGGNGTADTVSKAKKAGFVVREVA